MEQRLASGTGDARKIKAAAAALAETLPTAHVLGDVDALAARLAAIVEHADADGGRPNAPGATSTAPRRPRARRRWPPRPRSWPPTRPSGRPPATGCARSSTSGGRSAGWTARPTTRCGSGTRRPARRSTAAAARTSPSSTGSAPAPGRPRRRCASAPRNCPTPPTGAPPAAAFRDLLTEWKAAGRAAKDVDDALWHRFKAAQDTFFAARNAASAERDAEFRANAEAKEALLAEAEKLDTSDLDAARAALRAIGDKWDAIGKVPRERSADLERTAARGGEEGARRRRPGLASIPRPRPAPTSSGPAPSSSSGRPRRPRPPAAPRTPRQAQASAEQWRQWADAAADALGKKALESFAGRPCLIRAPVVSSGRSSSSRPLLLTFAGHPATFLLGGQLQRGAGPHHPGPVVGQHDHRDPRDDQPDPRPGMRLGRRSAATTPPAGPATMHRRAGQRDPRQRPAPGQQRQHREADAEHQRQPGEHPRRQRHPVADRRIIADQHVQPLAPPVCGRMNVSSSTNTQIAITNALAPGSISRAIRRSAASMSPLKSVEVAVVAGRRRSPRTSGRRRRSRAPRCRAYRDRRPGMPQAPTPVGPLPAACASPARVRRWASTAPSAIRWCGAAPVTVVVTMSPGRIVELPGAKCTSRPSRARPDIRAVLASLRPSPVATSSSTVRPTCARVLLQRDLLLQLDQPLIALGHNSFRQLARSVRPPGCRAAWSTGR